MTPVQLSSSNNSRHLGLLAIVSAFVIIGGVSIAPDRIWSNLLVVAFYWITLGLGGTLFIALTYVSNAGWNVSFRRVPEAMAVLLTPASLALLAVLALGREHYSWHPHGEGESATS